MIVQTMPIGIIESVGSALGAILVNDTFTDTNGVALDAHTPDIDTVGGGWTRNLQTQVIQNNLCEEDINNSVSVSTIDAGVSDCIIEADVTFSRIGGAFASGGIALRFSNTTNYWACIVWSSSATPWSWAIAKIESGSVTSEALDTGVSTGNVTVTRAMKITISGTSIRMEVPDENIDINTTNSFNQTETLHGTRMFRSAGASTAKMDNYKITSL